MHKFLELQAEARYDQVVVRGRQQRQVKRDEIEGKGTNW